MLRILHIEDDIDCLTSVREAFAGVSEVVLEQVKTLSDARVRLSAGPVVDVLLLDLRLPDARGTEAIVALRGYQVPIVVLSAMSLPETLERAAEAGADDYIVKGKIDVSMVIRRVRFVCARWQRREKFEDRPLRSQPIEASTFEALKPFITFQAAH